MATFRAADCFLLLGYQRYLSLLLFVEGILFNPVAQLAPSKFIEIAFVLISICTCDIARGCRSML